MSVTDQVQRPQAEHSCNKCNNPIDEFGALNIRVMYTGTGIKILLLQTILCF